jgi:AcrR family transcriptional regulator
VYSLTVKGKAENVETRERILGAAERVMREKGLARSTTKEIAREAGYSEGTLYKHFESKEELFLYVLKERLPEFVSLIKDLPNRAGQETVQGILGQVATAALAFYGKSVPISASIFSEPELLARHRQEIGRRDAGPQKANEAVAAYLEAEQRLGRVREDAVPGAAAAALLGACFQRAFLHHFLAEGLEPGEDDRFAEEAVRSLMLGLSPGEEHGGQRAAGLCPNDS